LDHASVVVSLKQRLREHDNAVYVALCFVTFEDDDSALVKALKEAYEQAASQEITDDDIPF
jgi:hypothetical protein